MATDNATRLAQARVELRQIRKFWLNPAGAAQIRAELLAAKERTKELYDIVTDRNRKLTQARAELKDLQGANHALVQQLADVTENREYWYKEAQDAEAEVKQLQTDLKLNARMLADQCDQACEAENKTAGLWQQLAQAETQVAAAQKAAEWLWGFWDGNTLIPKPGYEDDIREAWGKLLKVTDSTNDAIQLQERLATLDAAEAALAECGIGGIFAEFDGLADAINQMAQHIKELSSRLTQVQADLDAEPIEVEITGQEMVEALQAEHQLRQEAERCHKAALILAASREARLDAAEHRAEDLEQEWDDVHQALNECQVPRDYPDGTGASCRTRIFWLNQHN